MWTEFEKRVVDFQNIINENLDHSNLLIKGNLMSCIFKKEMKKINLILPIILDILKNCHSYCIINIQNFQMNFWP